MLRLKSLVLFATCTLSVGAAENFSAVSPDGSVTLSLSLADDNRLSYEVTKDNRQLVAPSALGLRLSSISLHTYPSGVKASTSTIDEVYTLPHGKVRNHHNLCTELLIEGTHSNPQRNINVRFRIYDNAVAFRYELNGRQGASVTADLSEVNIAGFRCSYAQAYHNDYSWYYERRDWNAMRAEKSYNVPVLIQCADNTHILLTEAAATSSMAASAVVTAPEVGHLSFKPAGNSTISSDTFISPWRTLIIGTPEEIVESARLTDLNEAADADIPDWIRPGRVAWNWGAEDGDGHPTYEQVWRYIDMASHMGWEYFLLDDGWKNNLDLSTVARYAEEKGVGLLIWANQADFINDYDQVRSIFSEWSATGVKGVKIDFFEDDSQAMLQKYETILRAAADARLMVNFHGCTKPSGLERQWPNLLTSEAVLGGEFYMFNTTMTPASHAVNLTLTRNVLGSMDYTPVKFGNKNGRMVTDTTWAYQLALAVAFESALQCFCDTPENIIGSVAEPLLRQLPTVWDEIRCLEATPGSDVTIARRNGADWWLATLTSEAAEKSIKLDFLEPDRQYYAYIYSEGFCRSDIAFEMRQVTASDSITFQLGADSGASVIISENPSLTAPFCVKMEAEKYNHLGQRVSDENCSGGAYISALSGARKYLRFTDVEVPEDGEYNLTLFYRQSGSNDAYIAVNDGEKVYHNFRDTGNSLYFRTITLNLRKGANTITIGNENGTAPGFDRIVLTGYFNNPDYQPGISSVSSPSVEKSPVVITGSEVNVNTDTPADIRIYSPDGLCIVATAGNSLPLPSEKGLYIIQVTTNNKTFNHKIFKQ